MKKIPINQLVRAYELWSTTDLTRREIAQALGVSYSGLANAINLAEKHGLGSYKPKKYIAASSRLVVLRAVRENMGRGTTRKIAEYTHLDLRTVRSACYALYRMGLLCRSEFNGKREYIYH